LDQSYPTASFTDTSPLLLLLGVWGVVTGFRPRGVGQVHLTRIILFGAAISAGGVLLWGYISQRYLGDLMPFFIIAGAVGLIDIWRRLEARSTQFRGVVLGGIVTAAVYCIAANFAIAMFPVSQWIPSQDADYIAAQQSLSFTSLSSAVHRGTTLPYWAPAGQIFAMDNCSGLYLSSGNDMTDVPGQQLEHFTWTPVEESKSYTRVIGFTFNRPVSAFTKPTTVMTYGKSKLVLEPVPHVPGDVQLHLYDSGTNISWPSPISWHVPITPAEIHNELDVVVTVDPNLHRLRVMWYDNEIMIEHYVAGDGPAIVQQTASAPGAPPAMLTVRDVPLGDAPLYASGYSASSQMTLCHNLTQTRS
jgi:hypothetical protein